jgi:hypothetical protein
VGHSRAVRTQTCLGTSQARLLSRGPVGIVHYVLVLLLCLVVLGSGLCVMGVEGDCDEDEMLREVWYLYLRERPLPGALLHPPFIQP